MHPHRQTPLWVDMTVRQTVQECPLFVHGHRPQARLRTTAVHTRAIIGVFNRTSDLVKPRDLAEWRPWARVGRKRGNILPSPLPVEMRRVAATSAFVDSSRPLRANSSHLAMA